MNDLIAEEKFIAEEQKRWNALSGYLAAIGRYCDKADQDGSRLVKSKKTPERKLGRYMRDHNIVLSMKPVREAADLLATLAETGEIDPVAANHTFGQCIAEGEKLQQALTRTFNGHGKPAQLPSALFAPVDAANALDMISELQPQQSTDGLRTLTYLVNLHLRGQEPNTAYANAFGRYPLPRPAALH